MTIFFSPGTGFFYDDQVSSFIPEDGLEYSTDERDALLAGASHGRRIVAGADGYPVLIDPPVVVASCPELCALIDMSADKARAAVAGDPLRAVEYQHAADEAQAFKDAGYPAEAVPPMVAAWAIGGRTAQEAADSILGEAAAYNGVLVWIRTTRLAAKEQIKALFADEQQAAAEVLATETVDAIRAAVTWVGNNAGALA